MRKLLIGGGIVAVALAGAGCAAAWPVVGNNGTPTMADYINYLMSIIGLR